MLKKTMPIVAPLLILFVMLLPLFFVDTLIIYFLNGTYSSLFYLALFLLVFYVVDFLVGLIVDSFLSVVGERTALKINDFVSVCADFVGSLVVLRVLTSLFEDIHLTTGIQFVIVLVHTLLFYLVSQYQGADTSIGDGETGLVNKAVELEIQQILSEEDVVACIETMRERHPELPFKDIVKTVRKINQKK